MEISQYLVQDLVKISVICKNENNRSYFRGIRIIVNVRDKNHLKGHPQMMSRQ